MRPRLLLFVALASVAPTEARPRVPAPGAPSLTRASPGPTLVVGNGPRIESIDPTTGRVTATLEPFDVADLRWKRLDRRGRYLLAEGWSELRTGPVPYFERGIVLLDDTGAVLWTLAQAFPLNGFARTLFLGEDGSVGLDAHDGPGIILVDGTKVETPAVPVGAVVGGVAPLAQRGEDGIRWWVHVARRVWERDAEMTRARRKAIEQHLVVSSDVEPRDGTRRAAVAIELAVDLGTEDDMDGRSVKTLARIPLPDACQSSPWLYPTLAPERYVLRCDSDPGQRPSSVRYFAVNTKGRTVAPIRPPLRDDRTVVVGASIAADGTVLAAVSSGCTSDLFAAPPGKGWRQVPFEQVWGIATAPAPIAGSIAMHGVDVFPRHGCGGAGGTAPAVPPADWTYVRRRDGSWLALPYRIAPDASPDGTLAITADRTAVVRIDREQRIALPRPLQDEPYAWIP